MLWAIAFYLSGLVLWTVNVGVWINGLRGLIGGFFTDEWIKPTNLREQPEKRPRTICTPPSSPQVWECENMRHLSSPGHFQKQERGGSKSICMFYIQQYLVNCWGNSLTFWEMRLFTLSLRVQWEVWHHNHVCELNMMLWRSAGCLSLAEWLETGKRRA